MLNEISQSQKDIMHDSTYIRYLSSQFHKNRKENGGYQELGEAERGDTVPWVQDDKLGRSVSLQCEYT